MRKTLILFTLSLIFIAHHLRAQNVGIGTLAPEASAKLDISDTARGILIPRMTAVQRNAIITPAQGLLVFVTNDSSFYFFKNGWQKLVAQNEGWGLSGNSGTNPATHFIGTTDVRPLQFKVANINAGQINPINANTGFGLLTFDSITTGDNNTSLGTYALRKNTSGDANVSVGSFSLINNKSGGFNISIGYANMANSDSANANVSLGAYALGSNRTGFANVAVGYNTLAANRSGSLNVALGAGAGNANITGENNTFIGANSNAGRDSLLNATAIGYGAEVSQSNSLVLGGTGSLLVNVGIGVPEPHALLHLANQNGKKIILFEDANNDNQYYGFGIDPGTLRYQAFGEHAFFIGNNATTSTEVMRIRVNGKVGIGTPTPRERLDINGAITITNGGYGGVGNNAGVPVPVGGAGTIIFSNGHFLGWNGSQWKQLDN